MNEISKCCKSTVRVYSSNEGTNHYVCNNCDKACDVTQGRSKEKSINELYTE